MARKWTEEEINTVTSTVKLTKMLGWKVTNETDTEVTDPKGTHTIAPIEETCDHCTGTSDAARELPREDCRRHHTVQARYLGYKRVICPQQFADCYD